MSVTEMGIEIQHDSLPDRRLTDICRMFYEQNLSKTEIAQVHRISLTHVNRLLREARERGILEIQIRSPRFEDLELRIIEKYGLRDARVVQGTDDVDAQRAEIAREAASYFEQHVPEGSKVGLSSGRTMFELVSGLQEKPRQLTIYPLNVVVESNATVASVTANTVATALWFRCRPVATAHQVEMFFPDEPDETLEAVVASLLQRKSVQGLLSHIDDLDFYFLGAAPLRSDSQIVDWSKRHGSDLLALSHRGIVGDIAFNLLNAAGEQVFTGIENLLFHTDIETLKGASSGGRKLVVLVAGGRDKTRVVKAALLGKICNTLICDSDMAQGLLT